MRCAAQRLQQVVALRLGERGWVGVEPGCGQTAQEAPGRRGPLGSRHRVLSLAPRMRVIASRQQAHLDDDT